MRQSKVLVYLANGIGNCILAIPALKSLKLLGFKVDLAIPEEWPRSKPLFSLFKNQPFVDEILPKKEDVRPEIYSKIFVPITHEKSSFKSYLEQFPQTAVVSHPKWSEALVHEAEYLMAMPRSVGYLGPMPDVKIVTSGPDSLLSAPYLALAFSCLEGHPWSHKRWPMPHWVALLKLLIDKLPGYRFVFVGGPGDTELAQAVVAETNSDVVVNMCGTVSLIESAHIISKSECLVTVDNGISHLGAATDVKAIIALYGPTLLSKNIPLHKNTLVVKSDIPCSPCFDTKLFRACQRNDCMDAISPELIADCVIENINRHQYFL